MGVEDLNFNLHDYTDHETCYIPYCFNRLNPIRYKLDNGSLSMLQAVATYLFPATQTTKYSLRNYII